MFGYFDVMVCTSFVFLVTVQSILVSVTTVLDSYSSLFVESVLYMTSIL